LSFLEQHFFILPLRGHLPLSAPPPNFSGSISSRQEHFSIFKNILNQLFSFPVTFFVPLASPPPDDILFILPTVSDLRIERLLAPPQPLWVFDNWPLSANEALVSCFNHLDFPYRHRLIFPHSRPLLLSVYLGQSLRESGKRRRPRADPTTPVST